MTLSKRVGGAIQQACSRIWAKQVLTCAHSAGLREDLLDQAYAGNGSNLLVPCHSLLNHLVELFNHRRIQMHSFQEVSPCHHGLCIRARTHGRHLGHTHESPVCMLEAVLTERLLLPASEVTA